MSDRPPSFDELAGGDDLSPEEAARLERVHNLLIEAGPPPELPPHLLQEPDPEGTRRDNVVGLPRRRAGALLGIAAALALTAFLGGFVWGTRHAPFNEDFSVNSASPLSSRSMRAFASRLLKPAEMELGLFPSICPMIRATSVASLITSTDSLDSLP